MSPWSAGRSPAANVPVGGALRGTLTTKAFAYSERGRPDRAAQLERLYETGVGAYTRRPVVARTVDPLAPFGPAVRAWFEATFEAPTQAQTDGWAAISRGEHTLIHA